MAKKKEMDSQEAAPSASTPRIRIGILTKRFMVCKSYAPHIHANAIRGLPKGYIVINESELDELLQLGAPVEVYYKDVVDGTTED